MVDLRKEPAGGNLEIDDTVRDSVVGPRYNIHFVSIVATILKKMCAFSGAVNAGSSETGRTFSWMLPTTEGIIKLIVDL
jgi:hypothetical protein